AERRARTRTRRDSGARWAPEGRRIAFVSQRDGTPQLYVQNVDSSGDAVRLTSLSGGADNVVWSPDAQRIAFTSEVYPSCADDPCNAAKDDAREKGPSRARIYDALLY